MISNNQNTLVESYTYDANSIRDSLIVNVYSGKWVVKYVHFLSVMTDSGHEQEVTFYAQWSYEIGSLWFTVDCEYYSIFGHEFHVEPISGRIRPQDVPDGFYSDDPDERDFQEEVVSLVGDVDMYQECYFGDWFDLFLARLVDKIEKGVMDDTFNG